MVAGAISLVVEGEVSLVVEGEVSLVMEGEVSLVAAGGAVVETVLLVGGSGVAGGEVASTVVSEGSVAPHAARATKTTTARALHIC